MIILITGGSSGLGASIVKLLAVNPENHIYFTYASSFAAAAHLEAECGNCKGIRCDFSIEADIEALIAKMPEYAPDVLINNAYTHIHKDHFNKIPPAVFSESFSKNVMPVLRITQEAIKIFRKKKFGKIINILSAALISKPPTGWSEYTANKAYLLSMSKSWAIENARFNISSNSISPSFMQTALTGDTDERMLEQMIDNHPLGKLLTTNEAAEAVLYLMNASQHVNGTNMVMNAGTDLA